MQAVVEFYVAVSGSPTVFIGKHCVHLHVYYTPTGWKVRPGFVPFIGNKFPGLFQDSD